MGCRSLGLMLLLGLAAAMSTGCSGGGDSTGPAVQEGVFADSLVEGLEYRTETQSGVTDAGGRFRYVEGETIEFFIGGIIVGQAVAGPVMTPVDLVEGAADETDEEVTNIARFLQTVDDDGDPENGILITEEVRQAAVTLSVDFSMTIVEFETDDAVVQAVSTLTSFTLAGPRGLVSVTLAQFHLRVTLQNLDDFDDADGDGFSEEEGDCDDADDMVYPGAEDICGDGVDQDCDGADAVCASDPDVDDDEDGFTENEGDCDDADNTVFPGAEEVCGDGVDQDCDGEDLVCPDVDADGDGFFAADGDCNDDDATIYPGAPEICGDGIDQDCDGTDLVCDDDDDADDDGDDDADDDDGDDDADDDDGDDDADDDGDDDDDAEVDADGDGFTVAQGDCDDEDDGIYPGAFDICGNGVDENCDGADTVCVAPPAPTDPADVDDDNDGFTENQGDCDDADPAVNPGAVEVCGNGVDEDCVDGDLDCDAVDNDGDNYSVAEGDCDDEDAGIFPGAEEVCGDGIDQDCDGADLVCTDEGILIVGDDGVEGVEYETETQRGLTGQGGRFQFLLGETVTFSIGEIELGAITMATGVSPVLTVADLVGGPEDSAAVNICRFLMTLDDDDNPENGITIGSLVRRFATMSIDFDLDLTEFEEDDDVTSAIRILTAYRIQGRRPLVFAFRARLVLQYSIQYKVFYRDAQDMDEDGDGFTVGDGDCDDTDPDIYPGAEEICGDGIDQDCDGEDIVCPEDLDKDEDGDGFTVGDGDCDDTDPTIYPGAVEIPDDGIDQDCDGEDLVAPVVPVDGTFSGVVLNADGIEVGTIRFFVDDDDVSGLSADVTFEGDCEGGETVEAGSASVEIEDGNFVFSAADWEIVGIFMGDAEAEGTWYYRDSTCEGEAAGTGTWIADWQDASDDPDDMDEDGDGFSPNQGDCDDADSEIHPGVEELCGGTDDLDCDGFIQTCAAEDAAILTGRLLLGNITGLEYRTETQRGRTVQGAFHYIEGESVTFYLGGITIGAVVAAPELTPFDLADEFHAVFNICRFLITLDADDDLSNGILISEPVWLAAYHAGLMVDFSLDESDFEEDEGVSDAIYLLTGFREIGQRLLALSVKVEGFLAEFFDDDGDEFSEYEGDCDDDDPTVYPGTETCPDDDMDKDEDGYTIAEGDCDDDDPEIYPGVGGCPEPTEDNDGDGFSIADGDCDDSDDAVYPGAEEICGDGIDQDCDGADLVCVVEEVVNGDWAGTTDQEKEITFTVADGKVSNISVIMDYVGEFEESCEMSNLLRTGNAQVEIVDGKFAFSTDWVEVAGAFTSATEAEGTWFYENTLCEGSGSGTWTASVSEDAADMDGDGITVEQGDCNDEDPAIYPGAGEICGDGIDQDCDGEDLVCEDSDLGELILSLTARNLDEDAYQSVFLTVKQVQIQGRGGWRVVESAFLPRTLALFDLAGGISELLVEGLVPAGLEGRYNQIRLVLDEEPDDEFMHPFANYIVLPDGTEAELKTPSALRSGVKINYEFTILKDRTTELKLTFDALRSLQGKNGRWMLRPVLRVTALETDDADDDDAGDDDVDDDNVDDDDADDDDADDEDADDDDADDDDADDEEVIVEEAFAQEGGISTKDSNYNDSEAVDFNGDTGTNTTIAP